MTSQAEKTELELRPACQVAFHTWCRGPWEVTVGKLTVRLPCACPCHQPADENHTEE